MRISVLRKLIINLCALTSVPSVSALVPAVNIARSVGLLPRDTQTCGGETSLDQCGGNFPSDFCCQSSASCLPLSSSSGVAAICCPAGSDCTSVQPVDCDPQLQNATANPFNQFHSTDLTTELATCDGKCCPPGYTCDGKSCVAIATPSATPTPTPTPSGTTSHPDQSGQFFLLPASEASSCNKFPPGAVMAGFFPGTILGVVLTIVGMWALKKRRERISSAQSSPSWGNVSRQISDPIYDPAYAARVDFIRRGSNFSKESHQSNTPLQNQYNSPRGRETAPRTPRIRSLFSRTPKTPQEAFTAPSRQSTTRTTRSSRSTHTSHSTRSEHSSRRKKRSRSRKPRDTVIRSDSTETIDVIMPQSSFLAPPLPMVERDKRLTSNTTFTSLMENAGYSRQSQDGVRKLSSGYRTGGRS